jgi:hypothetical protein
MVGKRFEYLARLSAAATSKFNDHAMRGKMLSYVA